MGTDKRVVKSALIYFGWVKSAFTGEQRFPFGRMEQPCLLSACWSGAAFLSAMCKKMD